MSAALMMGGVAALLAVLAGLMIMRCANNEAGIYRQRIAATMLVAAALILAGFAVALWTWSRASA